MMMMDREAQWFIIYGFIRSFFLFPFSFLRVSFDFSALLIRDKLQ